MNVLLIYPEIPDTFWSFKYALDFIRKKATLPPLGLLTIASILPTKWQKRLVDLNTTRLTAKHLEWADYAFISAMAVQRESARQIISMCKNSGVKVVAGGALFTTEYKNFDSVDHFVLNEAELTLPKFLEDLERKSTKRLYSTTKLCDIQKTPEPMWELIDLKQYASMSIQFSRGCPFDCEFCNVTTLFGHRPRFKRAEQVINELDGLYKNGWRGQVFFADDNLIGNKKYLKTRLLPALIDWQKTGKRISFYTQASINLADDLSLMDMMVKAGFNEVFIGIETPDAKGLAECNKCPNVGRDLLASVRRIQRSGLRVQGGFIVGFDSDSDSIFQRQIDFIQSSGIVTAMVGVLQAYTGTRLYTRLEQEGRIQNYSAGDNANSATNIIPKMDLKKLKAGYENIVQYIYSPDHFYERVKVLLREYKRPRIRPTLDFQRIMALIRASIRLGLLGKERFCYWRLLFWTLLQRPASFPLAVTLAIHGYHFRKIYSVNTLRNAFPPNRSP